MKHYTHEWIQADWEPDSVRDQAAQYFESIADRLPDAVNAFREAVNLHDASVRRIVFDAESNVVRIEISELYWDENAQQRDRRTLILTYSRRVAVDAVCGPGSDRTAMTLYKDAVVADEWDVEDDCIVHRLLFCSGAEWQVRFSNFEYHHPAVSPE